MKPITTLTALALATFLTGCATFQSGQEFDSSKVDQIETGETTQAQIEQWFGTPQGTGVHSVDGELLEQYTYLYSESQVKAESYIPFIGIFLGGSEGETKTLTIHFDDEDKVFEHHMSTSRHDSSVM
ncbi:outer membrane protein assembly factor BamE (lipoprotein component of BamABCDE complex) [Tamilnaduibacter salinus]|uniref:Outer membrane protein assembly factor BamE (Lipoprotein component of BamABCDE complex) n=1 Tax=Tamilnaduibacter salinus TaxID=1484056 RepID=A0A2U1CXC5_9GAMM|nr:outer membrane protein assembly factor BamE [Tamilnaduibacter salinus]PVY76865.1 outer membrane protein assembly factor BamE (lipoprotein component of BamABCDE complex) [Tamilnaduibacter salinus]